jgi:hypothetical protein
MINTSFAARLATEAANGWTAAAANLPRPLYNQRGQRCAQITEDPGGGLWLDKTVDCSKHRLRTPPAFAVDAAHLIELARVGGDGVRLTDEHSNVWTASLADFEHHGFVFDRGHGQQVGLPLARWRVERFGERQLSMFEVAR